MSKWIGEDRKARDHEIERETRALGFTPDDFWRAVDPTGERDWRDAPVMVSELFNWTLQARERVEECFC